MITLLSKKIKAFTLLEMLITMAILAIIAGIGVPVYQSLQTKNNFKVDVDSLTQSIYRAQSLAQAAKNDSDWSLHFREGEIIIYEGSDFVSRDQSFDEVFKISKSNTVAADNDVSFNKFSGFPKLPTIINVNSLSGEFTSLSLNEVGLVEYNIQ